MYLKPLIFSDWEKFATSPADFSKQGPVLLRPPQAAEQVEICNRGRDGSQNDKLATPASIRQMGRRSVWLMGMWTPASTAAIDDSGTGFIRSTSDCLIAGYAYGSSFRFGAPALW